ncbi:thermonuclease family protein [Nocardioides anomalus]|uniref:Thermonuclease family protein n=1 Tax=Nocardioides anomalus TaxID=2712223 RepID=A0A6G6WA21_9ACTN|nr:thermonuclease family protein [Nocardioides anomalus]QIG42066.1 thermonuclease family protein [Nocardioides anomalus]
MATTTFTITTFSPVAFTTSRALATNQHDSSAHADRRASTAKVVRWVDGDTVKTSVGRIRLIGVDTPEEGQCGYTQARKLAQRLAPVGTTIRLGDPPSVQNKDSYGRLLRYVNHGRIDIGLRQIQAGSAARYDSLDGYDPHPRETVYRQADLETDPYCTPAGPPPPPPPPPDLTSYPPIPGTWDCPTNAPIKGNRGETEWIYHLPTNKYYSATNPEECFATEAGALAAGYRPARV